jgi:hypothetical protein
MFALVTRYFVRLLERFLINIDPNSDRITVPYSREIIETQCRKLAIAGRSSSYIGVAVADDFVAIIPDGELSAIVPFTTIDNSKCERSRLFAESGTPGHQEQTATCELLEDLAAFHTPNYLSE